MGMDALSVWTGLAPRGAFGHRPPRKQLSRVPQWRVSIRQRILPQSTSSEAWDSSHASGDSDGGMGRLLFLSRRFMAALPRHPAKAALAAHLLPDEQADEADAHEGHGKPVAVFHNQVNHEPLQCALLCSASCFLISLKMSSEAPFNALDIARWLQRP